MKRLIHKLTHLLLISLLVLQNLIYPWISILPAPPPAYAEESPPPASHSAATPAPSPLEPLLNLDEIFSSTQSADTIPPETIPEATQSAQPEVIPEASASASPSPSLTPSPTPTPSPVDTSTPSSIPESSPTPTSSPAPVISQPPVLNALSINLTLPFTGTYPLSYGFGEHSSNNYVRFMQTLFQVDSHDGLDYAMPQGTPILAADSGTVVSAGPGLYGTTIIIEHTWGLSYYGHLSSVQVKPNDRLSRGSLIGLSGSTGISTGPHLHFGIKPAKSNLFNGYRGMIDPRPYLNGQTTLLAQTKVLGATAKRHKLFKTSYKSNEQPSLTVGKNQDVELSIKDSTGHVTEPGYQRIAGTDQDTLLLEKPADFKPGVYVLSLTDQNGVTESQNFAWGVLALNTNKSVYLPGETANLSLAVLDEAGHVVCDSSLTLSITSPSGEVAALSTQSGDIIAHQNTCLNMSATNDPDYSAQYQVGESGTYQLSLEAETANGLWSLTDSFTVADSVPYDVERVTATRLYPLNKYQVKFVIKPSLAYRGTVTELVPAKFIVSDISPQPANNLTLLDNFSRLASREIDPAFQPVDWEVDWQAGETYTLSYTYDPPDLSPAYFELGPLQIGAWQESRVWQLAVDATSTYDFASCAAGNTCDTSTSWWASGDDVDVFYFLNDTLNRNTHTEVNDTNYTALSASDDSRYASVNPGTSDEIVMWFEMDITEDPATIGHIDFTYEGSTTAAANFSILVKDDTTAFQDDEAWTYLGTQNIAASTETTMTATLSGVDFANYIDANGIIIWAVVEDISAVVVSTDYVKMDVVTHTVEQEGYRFRNDNGSETTATWFDAQDTNITTSILTNTRLRTILNDTVSGDQPTTQYQLEYKLSSDSIYRPVQPTSSGSVSYVGEGTSSANGTTWVSVDAPLTVSRGDLLVMGVASKYDPNFPTAPAGWTALPNNQATGGTGTGVDAGAVTITVFVKEAEGWEDAKPFSVDIPSGNSAEANITAYSKTAGKEWDLAMTTGTDTTVDTTWSVTGAADPGLSSGDRVAIASAINCDLSAFATHSLTATGATIGANTERQESASTGGDGVDLVLTDHSITGGTSSATPLYTAAVTGTNATCPVGASAFLRMRQVDAPIQMALSANVTASGENTTAQLTAPTGAPTFTAGRLQDDENPADTVDINDSQYTEMEWSITATAQAANAEIYQFRVTAGGEIISTYTVTPQLTIGGLPSYAQPNFRLRSGDTASLNSDTSWAAALNTNATMDAGGRFRVRFEVEESTGNGTSKSFILQYRWKPNGGGYGSWVSAPNIGAVNEDGPIQVLDSAMYADGDAASTNLLAGSSETFDTGGSGEENRTTAALTISNEHAEYEFTVMIRGTYAGPVRVKDNDSFDLRMVESTGTEFTGTYVNPTITVNMPDYYIGTNTIESPGHIGPFKDSNGNLYLLIEPTFTSGTGENEPEFLKSTDAGKSWDLVNTAGSPTANDPESVDIYQSGDTLHMCQFNGISDDITYHTFRMSDHATNPDTWGIIDETVTLASTSGDQSCGIVKRSDNTIVVAHRYNDGTNERVGYKIRSSGGVWGSLNNLDSTASVDFVFSGMVLGASDKTHFFYKDDINNDIYHKSLDSSNTLSAAEAVETDAEASLNDWASSLPVYWDDGGNEKIMILVQDDSDKKMYAVTITNDGTPAARQTVTVDATRRDPLNSQSEQPVTDLVVDPETDNIFAFATPAVSGDIDRYTSLNGAAWSTNSTIKTLTANDYIRGQLYTHSALNGGSKVYGYVYEDDGQGRFGFSWYGEEQVGINPGSSFQRKTWYDGTRYWRSYQDGVNRRLVFEYSTDGTSWTEDTSARINNNSGDFTIQADSTDAYVAYKTGEVVNTDNLVTDSNLEAYWKMNEANWTSNLAADSSGNGFDGTAVGDATTSTGKFANGGIFAGTGDRLTVSDNAALRPGTGSWSIATWINPSNVDQSSVIVQKSNLGTGMSYHLSISGSFDGSTDGKQILAAMQETGTTNRRVLLTDNDVVDGSWHHVAVVFNSSNDSMTVYVDGVSQSITTSTNGTWPNLTNTDDLMIGSYNIGVYDYIGLMDDLRIYSKALTAEEVASLGQPGYDIEVRKATSYPGTGFAWSAEDVALNGSSVTDNYSYPTLAEDSNSKLWVGATGKNSDTYTLDAARSTSASDSTLWDALSVLDSSSNSSKYGVIVPRTSGAAYAAWVDGTAIEGKNYNGTAWDGSPTAIDTGLTGLADTISAVSDSSGNVYLSFVDDAATDQISHTKFNGTTWSTAALIADAADANDTYPSISLDSTGGDLYAFWIDSSTNDIYYSSCDAATNCDAASEWAAETAWQTTGTNVKVSSNYDGASKVFGQWYDGTSVAWDDITITTNTAPDVPATLTQQTTSDVVISTGGWHNTTSVKFTAVATDTDNPDTLSLCIEKDDINTAFSNTEDSCGTGVAYSGTGVSVSATIASQTDATEYHWQARIKDSAGAYSAWVSYGANSDTTPGADRDYGLDTTAPSGGAVYDGTGAGIDSTFSDSSLSALSANWDSFNFNVSGISKYEYSIGTTVGGTDIKAWTDNSTTTSVTATGLTLQSSILYYTNVRATDNAGNVSNVVSSNGQLVAPSISFAVSPLPAPFDNLNAVNSYTDTLNTTLTTSTNAYNGYTIRAFISDYLRSGDGLTTIPDFSSGTYASPATWSGSETGLGYTSSDTTIGGVDKFASGTLYAPFSHIGPGDIVADHTNTVSGTPVSNEVFTLTYKVKIDPTQAAKHYTSTVILTATAQY